jgi:uncharacterized protein (DUF736 family)
MDQVTLVENQIDDGKKLIEQLVQVGEEVTAAAWIKTSDDGMWFLYLALPGVEDEDPRIAYRRIQAVIRRMPQPFWLRLLDVKIIDSKDPLAVAATDYPRRHGAKNVLPYRGDQLGGVSIEGAYIYPPMKPVPQTE